LIVREPGDNHGPISPRSSTQLRIARLVTEVLAPAPIVAAILVVIAIHSTPSVSAALGWALLAVLFASVIPMAFVLWGVRRRRLSDRHVRAREQRFLPLLVGIASVFIGLALLSSLGAPRELIALVGAMIVGLMVSLVVTLAWKISIHSAVAGGATTIVVLVFGAVGLILFVIVGFTGWARVRLGDHTLSQVIGGSALGALVAATVFTLLR